MLTDMYAYFYGSRKPLPDDFDDYLDYHDAAVVSIDMHRGHVEDSPECPCPGPRGREVIEATDEFHRACRALGIPIIHVKMVLRADGSRCHGWQRCADPGRAADSTASTARQPPSGSRRTSCC